MALQVYANGYGVGEGRNDSKLKWPFIGSVKIELLNQYKDSDHYLKVVSLDERHNARVGHFWGNPQFIPHSKLRPDDSSEHYLKDNTLYFRVSVRVSSHKPWLDCTAE